MRDYETQSKANLQKKGEKITKFQVEIQGLQDRVKEEEKNKKKVS